MPDGSMCAPATTGPYCKVERAMHPERHLKGFTLIELMMVLIIASIILAAATPSFIDMTVRNRVITYTNDFIGTINYARSEAVRRGAPVSVCGTENGAACADDAWTSGWIVFTDADVDGDIDGGTDTVLRVHEGFSANYTLGADPALASSFTFGADGAVNNTGAFAVCHKGQVKGARAIVLTRLRPRVGKDTDNDRIPNLDGGNLADCANPSGA